MLYCHSTFRFIYFLYVTPTYEVIIKETKWLVRARSLYQCTSISVALLLSSRQKQSPLYSRGIAIATETSPFRIVQRRKEGGGSVDEFKGPRCLTSQVISGRPCSPPSRLSPPPITRQHPTPTGLTSHGGYYYTILSYLRYRCYLLRQPIIAKVHSVHLLPLVAYRASLSMYSLPQRSLRSGLYHCWNSVINLTRLITRSKNICERYKVCKLVYSITSVACNQKTNKNMTIHFCVDNVSHIPDDEFNNFKEQDQKYLLPVRSFPLLLMPALWHFLCEKNAINTQAQQRQVLRAPLRLNKHLTVAVVVHTTHACILLSIISTADVCVFSSAQNANKILMPHISVTINPLRVR